MSRTLNTRPIKVIEADPEAQVLKITAVEDPQAEPKKIFVIGGMNSKHGPSKLIRKAGTKQGRARVQGILHRIERGDEATDRIHAELTEIGQRTTGWRHAIKK